MKGKTQKRMEGGSRKRSSSAGSEKMERLADRHCSTGQSPQRTLVPMEEVVVVVVKQLKFPFFWDMMLLH
jgi:hypothetical protein